MLFIVCIVVVVIVVQGSISLGSVKLIINNIAVSNGFVHVIDAVLKPPELDPIVNRSCPIITTETRNVSKYVITIIMFMFLSRPSVGVV